MKDNEFSSPGQEFSSPGREFSPPGQEWSRAGREFASPSSEEPPRKKKRRLNPLMLTAAAVVTAAVVLGSSPATLPQPDNLCEYYIEYLNEIMDACTELDEARLYELTSSVTAEELWSKCLEPYYQQLDEAGYDSTVFFDGTKMTIDPGPVPVLYFHHKSWTPDEWTPEEIQAINFSPHLTRIFYLENGSRAAQGCHGVSYSHRYGGNYCNEQGELIPYRHLTIFFSGTLSSAYGHPTFIEGRYQWIDHRAIQGDSGLPNRSGSLEGAFSQSPDSPYVFYLENGVYCYNIGTSMSTIQVSDGRLLPPNEFVKIHQDNNNEYYISIFGPDGMGGSIWLGDIVSHESDPLYHCWFLEAYW